MSLSASYPEAVTRAQALVAKIADDHGYLGEEAYVGMDAEKRRKFQEAFLKKDRLIGSSVITLAKNLYSKDVRFIFELLQNADDNLYTRAKEDGQDPYVVFRMYRDRIVVECNEDGFTEENLTAICSIGKSSKAGGVQGYIGEKGIGFKSVFKVGWKVHIQSGAFSFSFTHRPGDSGMGMISPEWVPAKGGQSELNGTTRITITLLEETMAHPESIIRELQRLKPAMLLFLKKLVRVKVHLFDEAENETETYSMTRAKGATLHRAILETVQTDGDGNLLERMRLNYHVTEGLATGIAKSENRTFSGQEDDAQLEAASKAEIVLAFPLDGDSTPVIEPQDIFAFLPVRHVGFNFLIHSDFVTMANREDIVTTSPRNQDLRKHLARTFVDAVKQMCQDAGLRFQWMRYLPALTGYHCHDPFWSGFMDMLKKSMLESCILVPQVNPEKFRTIGQLRWFGSLCFDGNNQLLFDDLDGENAVCISQEYKPSDIDLLKGYGLKSATMIDHIIPMVEADLKRSNSKMKSPDTDTDPRWHTTAVKLLMFPFANARNESLESARLKIKTLNLLPLSTGEWISADTNTVHFPTTMTSRIPIPPGLGLKLVHPHAAEHPHRKRFFETLGVSPLASELVRAKILEKATETCEPLADSVDWLHFLYLTCPLEKLSPDDYPYSQVRLQSSDLADPGVLPSKEDVYISDKTDKYNPSQLLLNSEDILYLHSDYLNSPPTRVGGLDWINWLHDYVRVRRRLRLVEPDGSGLSLEALSVSQDVPEKFLGLLHYLWPHEGDKVLSSKGIQAEISKTRVLCEGGGSLPLAETILPSPRLKEIASRFLEPGDEPPFLKLEGPISDDDSAGWKFLDYFGVIQDDGLAFHLAILRVLTAAPRQQPSRVLDLYKVIYGKSVASANAEEAKATIRSAFQEAQGIYVPATQTSGSAWCALKDCCLLGATEDLEHKFPIDSIYARVFCSDARVDLSTVTHFLKDTLGIPRVSWRDYLDEVRFLKKKGCTDAVKIGWHYRRLGLAYKLEPNGPGATLGSEAAAKQLRQIFRDEELLFYSKEGQGKWCKTTGCLWSKGTGVQDRANLADQPEYNQLRLEDFFVNTLEVTRLTLWLVYHELLLFHLETPKVEAVKQHIRSFNSLLQGETNDEAMDPRQLLDKYILPVRYPSGEVRLQTAKTEFTAVDRTGDSMAPFYNMIKTLDFSMEEIHTLEPFLEWLGLTNRYLSKLVKETPDLGTGPQFRITEPRLNIKKKAHGLLRIAKHLRSPRFSGNGQALYDQLRTSETWETDDISSKLTVIMDGKQHSVALKKSEVYISNDTSHPLKIYIPHDEGAQDVCVQHALPRALVDWLLTDAASAAETEITKSKTGQVNKEKAIGVLKGLLNAKQASIPRILAEEGILDVEIPEQEATGDDIISELNRQFLESSLQNGKHYDTETAVGFSSPFRASQYRSSNYSSSLQDDEYYNTGTVVGSASPLGTSQYRSSNHNSQSPGESKRRQYLQLLSHVIEAAKLGNSRLAVSKDLSDMSPLVGKLSLRGQISLSAGYINDLTTKLGAAGELFVFEHLKKLRDLLPGFSLANWTSGMRNCVDLHPDYATTDPWRGPGGESDLEYDDVTGSFTKYLIESNHLSTDWRGETPKYHFGVHATPRLWNEPFYMTGEQYRKMKQLCAHENRIYIIFRVFKILTDEIDVKIYVNPAQLEVEDKLNFIVDKYSVKAT
ncbi:hypothetical protein QBC44DRAFT_384907 [Cladorrhinum sp. PSN332]|nr:hypothetical protein QBC44DRAFT_384907 [Cladorrhinum sp. PSN332]